ncbi:SLC13 family permease [Yoonia sp. SDW83-1]|uniref:SLC13 family permease n=1 Tax=Yoonia sp. SDW83-1 TaxID=3366945 RepID=UPI00398C666D
MTIEIILVLSLLVLAMILLATELLPIELVALLLVVVLAATGVLDADLAFQGFASETVVMLACVMVLSHRLTASGLIARFTRTLFARRKMTQRSTSASLMTVSALMSSFVTNTSTTAVLIPAATDLARRTDTQPRRFLMPLAFASMMGGSATLIGTSTNLAASGVIERFGLEPFSTFEFVGPALVISLAGIAVLTLFGPLLLPDTRTSAEEAPEDQTRFMATLVVPEGSKSVGSTIGELDFASLSLEPLAVSRPGGRVGPHPRRKLQVADRIIVAGPRDAVLTAIRNPRLDLASDVAASADIAAKTVVVDAVIMPGARWIGQTLKAMRLSLEPDLTIVALHRRGQEAPALIDRMRLKVGDVLLISGTRDRIATLKDGTELSILGTQHPFPPTQIEGTWTLMGLLMAIVLATTGVLPLSVGLLLAVLMLVLAGRMTLQDSFAMINWRILILIGGMSSFGLAMLSSGAATWLANGLLAVLGGYGPHVLLLGLGLLTILLTQPMSNAAAALTLLPVAIEMAALVGADPHPFVVMVTLSASLSFIAPFEPALLLVYGPGQYSFRDFPRAGLPLTVMSLVLLMVLVPVFWPLEVSV